MSSATSGRTGAVQFEPLARDRSHTHIPMGLLCMARKSEAWLQKLPQISLASHNKGTVGPAGSPGQPSSTQRFDDAGCHRGSTIRIQTWSVMPGARRQS